MQYPVWLMYVARAADFADSRQARELLKSAIGLACIGLTLWIGSIIQGAVMVQVSTLAATMGRMIKGSNLAHLLLIQGREYQTLQWSILTAVTVLVCLLLICAARFTHGVLKHILKSVVKGIVLASLFVLVAELIPQSPSPYVVYKPLVLAAFMLAAIIPLALAPLRAFRASLITLRALDGITRDAATGPDNSSAPQQSVTLYKRRPLLISLGMLASVAGLVMIVYGLDRASGRRPQQYPSTIAALNDSIGSFNRSTPRRAGTFERGEATMPNNARLQQLDVVAGQLNNKIWLQVVSGDSLPSKIDVEQLEQLAKMLNRGSAFNTVGVAQYRLGNYHAAIEACLKSLEFRSKEMKLPGSYAGDLAFLAMSHFQLGDKQEADKYRNQLAEVMQLAIFKDDKECLGFLKEANILFSGTAATMDSKVTETESVATTTKSNAKDSIDTITNSIGMKMVLISKGIFTMGSPESEHGRLEIESQYEVTISKDYYLGVTEVTQGQYEKVIGKNPSWFQGNRVQGDSSNHPVEMVLWEDAIEFCKKLSELPEEKKAGRVYRLPTEAEWEYACRAGSKTAYNFGESSKSLGDYAWFSENSNKQTHPVGEKKSNAWGLFDMHGNVFEWCSDWIGEYPQGAVSDPTGPREGSLRVLRGGSYFFGAKICRSAIRFRGALIQNFNNGFRVALSPSGIPN
jgi:formylglycine-generating enzyme required for sulfatase activity